ncbi:Clp protease N-terminal domain-containing protein [Actinomadura sp. K4S16]|uniref:Clp protease N-terminal domain-containing protein n=1 Tax=Actinomadura sp. K4S16 TaxID=1316147 RepID=UPI0011EF859E|nr:Clp protease N-terminal domain-containing protein [Actinomadura sp. K4S16]
MESQPAEIDLGPYTAVARAAVNAASVRARALDHAEVAPAHLLLGLVSDHGRGMAAVILNMLDVSLEAVERQVEERLGLGEQAVPGHLAFTEETHTALQLALRETSGTGSNRLGTDHLLLGLLYQDGLAAAILKQHGATLQEVIATREEARSFVCYGCAEFGHEAEPQVGPGPRLPPELDDIGRQIAQKRRLKEEAVDAQEYASAAAIRVEETALLRRRRALLETGIGEFDLATALDEIARLREAVDHLRGMLHRGHHGPHEPGTR